MSEVNRFNRFFRFAYPVTVFFAVVLAWNSAGQVNRLANAPNPALQPEYSDRSPAKVQTSCYMEHKGLREARSCTDENSPPWKLIDTNEKSESPFVTTAFERRKS